MDQVEAAQATTTDLRKIAQQIEDGELWPSVMCRENELREVKPEGGYKKYERTGLTSFPIVLANSKELAAKPSPDLPRILNPNGL